ncbi:ribosomal protein S18-alanine N-acetyltransferase [Ignisphaera sp. 4213-co]|uniref:Ribosomal protein S18-alanine N-acetyltransferase n=1 Tax=Ignisphaera cupida TaxID=3050454 RepID=A0ABD4Z4Y7_9CREN|nr:ribosomal protein S18-alanine N-acetyltransferase [Ignisphaera sp. 4213-co]MDK6028003.1 ribosomal protein S18-alanine N-acetyltransferase [Ignisphaera sp. 4213-co]
MIVIRKADGNDIKSVYELEKKCFKDPYPEIVLRMLYELYPELFLVAEDSETKAIIGYVSGMIRVDGFGHIVSICVDQNYRRRGIGKRLMEAIENVMHKIFSVCMFRLEVRVSNIPAIKLYESLGYRVEAILKNYYLDGEDGYLMTKKLC